MKTLLRVALVLVGLAALYVAGYAFWTIMSYPASNRQLMIEAALLEILAGVAAIGFAAIMPRLERW